MPRFRGPLPAILFPLTLSVAACNSGGAPEAAGSGGDRASAPAAADAAPASPAETASAIAVHSEGNSAADPCGASKVAALVSLEATPAVRAQVATKVGHDRIRWIAPGTAVTMDFSPERLNVLLDREDVITGARCS
jgi:hypothetical protein